MICPNCSKDVNDRFEYCNECGSKLDGSVTGDFRTDFYFVFEYPEGYVFLNAKNGRQVILKADSLDELEREVKKNGFIWSSRTKSKAAKPKKVLDSKDVFIPASSMKREAADTVQVPDSKDAFISESSAKRKKAIKAPLKKAAKAKAQPIKMIGRNPMKPFKITDRHVKRNPDVVFRDEEKIDYSLKRDYGILGVFKDTTQEAAAWAYKPYDSDVTIRERTLQRLKDKVESSGFKWVVINHDLAEESFDRDLREIQRKDAEIKAKNAQSGDIDYEMKSKLLQHRIARKSNENSTELDRMHR